MFPERVDPPRSPFLPYVGSAIVRYPIVTRKNNLIIVEASLENAKHKMPNPVFDEPPRFVLREQTSEKVVSVECRITAKNLENPIVQNVEIEVT